MTWDQVKRLLLSVRGCETEFSVIFSGKASKRVNGLYKPDTREIILHNKNFNDENELLYTAFHEYAHHLHAERHGGKISGRAHGSEFHSILHGLLGDAEARNAYANPFESVPELKQAGTAIRETYMEANGTLLKDMGKALREAERLCEKHHARFDDFLDRVLRLPKATARMAMRSLEFDLPPKLGYDAMKLVSSLPKSEERERAARALLKGDSEDEVRERIKEGRKKDEAPETVLLKEKARIERTIETLEKRLKQINEELGEE